MYWPFSTPTLLASSEDGQQVQSLAFSRTADLFLTLSYTQLDLFNAKVRSIIANSRQCLERAGSDFTYSPGRSVCSPESSSAGFKGRPEASPPRAASSGPGSPGTPEPSMFS
jgi:hypothetical protein